ncbi:hypothetical protein [Roseisolibacter sp. H3M3-2]|uniref:hypothetical protein n=1 Tax=Roseisolibacter sp. H3M3-2 TaxID=3031323 RepID=UPI0023DB4279|nr:hypothetical protein [Roseisolibacter sp. H3M3-2]MDF1505178.1 hypothetical protein [Roseisolibacter sp. H3M3-2]
MLLLGAARLAGAQTQGVQVSPPAGGDTLASVTPTFVVQAVGTGPGPLRFRFELSDSPAFAQALLDTAITTNATTITVRPTRALSAGTRVYWRASVTNPAGFTATSPVGPSRVVPQWIRPRSPVGVGAVVYDRRPTFVWSRPQVDDPPGPWQYEFSVLNNGQQVLRVSTTDTTFTPPEQAALETNAPYTWSVTARLRNGQSESFTTVPFTVLDSSVAPTATLVYQNFPNPFPSASRAATCIWVDIAQPSRVSMEIYTLRGVRVRRLLPNPELGTELGARRYGREVPGSGAGCDPRFEWNGTDDRGERVPAGVYLLRFRAEGVETVKKIVFRG